MCRRPWQIWNELSPSSPREALMAGVQLHFIATEESAHWSQMLRDRKLTSHTYNAAVADQIIERLLRDYLPAFRAALARLTSTPAT